MLSNAFYTSKASRIKLYFNASYYSYNKVSLGSFIYKGLSIPLGEAKLSPKGGFIIGCPLNIKLSPSNPEEEKGTLYSQELSLIPTLIDKFKTPSYRNNRNTKEDIILFNLFLTSKDCKKIHDLLKEVNLSDKQPTESLGYIKGTSTFICVTINVVNGCIVYPYGLDKPLNLPLHKCSYLSQIYDLITVDIQQDQIEELEVLNSQELITSQKSFLDEELNKTYRREKISTLISKL